MGRDGHDRPIAREWLELRAEIADPVARIDDQVALRAAHVPHVRLEERVEVILHESHDLIGDVVDTEPPFGDREIVHVRSVKKTDEGSGRRQCTDTIDALYEPTFGIATMSPSSILGIG